MSERHDPERYRRVKALFERALAEASASRRGLVERDAGADAALRDEVLALLDAHDDATTGFLARGARVPDAAAVPQIDRAWRVLREIGRGGMGVVYLAERADGAYEARVALKLIAPLVASDPEAVLRLKLERQILARLNHPNIARLLDGGTAASGAPYLVMEFVEGERLDCWCDERDLDVDARIELFLAVCDAVEYAHRNLVVHRDLKPGNVLVTADGVPKLLDFGIAKLLVDDSTLTATGGGPLTPRYASPEQIRGEPVTTQSDVYALGVMLYELLSGTSPYGAAVSTPHRLPQAICDDEPRPPSAGATTRRRGDTTPVDGHATRRRARLRGDLDAIVLKALRKRPADRYASVEALATDLRAQRAGLPVAARRGGTIYRLRKFARRHWPALATAAGVVALTIGFLVELKLQLDQTAIERDKAARVAEFMTDLFRIADPSESQGDTLTVRAVLDRGARSLRANEALAAPVRQSMLQTVARVYAQLGLTDAAEPLLVDALALAEKRGDAAAIADARTMLGALRVDQARYDEAIAFLQEAERLQRTGAPDDLELRARIRYFQGQRALRQAKFADAREPLEESLALRRRIHGPKSREVAETLTALAGVERDRGRLDVAEAHLREALAALEAVRSDAWTRAKVVNNLAVIAGDRGDFAAAERSFNDVLALMRDVLGDEHPALAVGLGNVASMMTRRGAFDEAEEPLAQALALRRKALGENHPLTGTALSNLAYNHFARGDYARAETEFRAALAMQTAGLGAAHTHTANTLRNLAVVRFARGDVADAHALAGQLVALGAAGLGADHPFVLQSAARRAFYACLRDACDRPTLEQAVAAHRDRLGAKHAEAGESLAAAAAVARIAGDRDAACAHADAARGALAAALPGQWDRVLAEAVAADCRGDAAARDAALAALDARYGAEHPLPQRLRAVIRSPR